MPPAGGPVIVAVLVLPIGCGGGESEAPPTATGCLDLEIARSDGTCIRPGVAPDGCAPGFLHDGAYGCEPVLPAEACPPGLMAVPGDGACRSIMACGEGKWGALPVEGDGVYVDASYAGPDGDGTVERPFSTIGAAYDAAAPGALIAVAAGSYVEDVVLVGKPVRLWGVCPERVEIVGTGAELELAALYIQSGASGTEVGGLALRGAAMGFLLSGSDRVLLDRVWVHDAVSSGINVESTLGPTSLIVLGSLVEQNHEDGVFVSGSDITLEASVIRSTSPLADGRFGRGIDVQLACSLVAGELVCDPEARGSVTLRGSVVEENHEFGLFVSGSDAVVEGSVVRATSPQVSDQRFGRGINVQQRCALVDAALVCDPGARATATLRGSLVEQSHDGGLLVAGSDATVEDTVVRATAPQASDERYGYGIGIQAMCLQVDAELVCDPEARASASVRGSLVEQNHEIGLFVEASDAIVERTVVRATAARPSDGAFGDGIAVFGRQAAASATVTAVIVGDSARAGLSNFGAVAALSDMRIGCAAFELEGEPYEGGAFVFEDRGGNLCGCPTADHGCVAVTAGLAPPDSLAPGE